MDVLVCVKRVPGTGSTILVTDDGMNVDTRHLGFTIGPHEECAVEEAIAITAEHGGSVTVLTVGPPDAEEQLRAALAMNADHGVLVDTGSDELDPEATAAAIVQAVRDLAGDGQRFDLVLFGNESADTGHYQVGVRVACELGLPMVGGIKGIELSGPTGAPQRALLRRDVPTGAEVYEVPLPAAVAVKEGLNLPRYPSMRGRLRATKAQLRVIRPEVRPGGMRKVRLRRPPEERPETIVLGHGADAAGAVVDVFEELGVLR